MKRILLASIVVLLVAGGAGTWYILAGRDPLQQGKELLKKGDVAAASLQLRNAVRDQPDNAEAQALLAQVRLLTGDPIAAETAIKRALAQHWDPASSQAILAQAYVQQQKWKEILAEIPDHGGTPEQTGYFLMTRAVAQRGLGDTATSKATMAEAERLAPQDADVHLTAARFAAADRDLNRALSEVDQSLALKPNRVDALALKSALLASKGDREGALAQIDKAVETAPGNDSVVIDRAGLLMAMGQVPKAAADVSTVLKRNPKDRRALFIQMVLLIRDNKFEEADVVEQKLDTDLAAFQRGQYFKAMIKARLQQFAQAEDAIISYVNRYPGDPDGLRLLASIEITTNHADRAIPYLQRAINAGRNDADTLNLLGRAYAQSGDRKAAEESFQQAAKAATTPQQMAQLASARLQIGDLSGAAADLQRSVEGGQLQPGAAEALIATSIRLGQLDRAQEALDRLQSQVGDTEAVGNLTGLLKLARLDAQGALDAFASTASRFPDSVGPKLNQAKVLLQLNRPAEALPILQAILEKDPTQIDALTILAQVLLTENRGDEAIAAAERARKVKPTDLGILNGEAQVYARLKQYDKAIDLLNGARVNGKLPTALLSTLAGIQLAAGQTDAAKQTLAELVTAEPNNVPAVLAQADLLMRVHDIAGERRVLDDALARMPGSIPLLQARVRADLIDQGLDAALNVAAQLRANPANLPGAATLKGGLLVGAKRFADAASAFQSEFDREPSSVLAVALAEAKQGAGDSSGAMQVLRGWQDTHPDDAAVARTIANLAISSHDLDLAQRNLEVALKQQPTDLVALNNYAWVLQQKGDKRSREFAQRAFEISPTPDVTDTLAWILVGQGESAKALPLLQRAAAGAPQNPAIRYHLAVALKDQNRPQDAISILKPVLDSNVRFEERDAAQNLMADLAKATP